MPQGAEKTLIRFIQIALLFAVMIPFAWMVKWTDAQLPARLQDVLTGVPIGMAIMLALNAWDRRIRRRG